MSVYVGLPLVNVFNDMISKDDLRSPIVVEDDDASCSMESLPSLEEVEKIIGYSFKNQSLLQQAFTHQSYQHKCESYERLEFVGDSVLNLLITRQQFNMYPNLPPGMLSPLRSANVDTEKLARVAIKYDLLKYLRHNNRKLSQQVSDYCVVTLFFFFFFFKYHFMLDWALVVTVRMNLPVILT